MLRKICGACLILAGLSFLGLSFSSRWFEPGPHSKHQSASTHKSGLPVIGAADASRRLAELDGQAITPEQLAKITRVFASAIVRYWPKQDDQDPEVLRNYRENWLLALAQRISFAAPMSGNEIATYERRDYRAILGKGVGICSQAALAVADYLDRKSVPVKIAGLDGHVVAVAELNGQSFILDADYGVVLPMTLEEAEISPDLVRDAYLARGYPAATAERVSSIFGPDGNKLVAPGAYMETAAWRLRLFDIGVWLIPALSILIGVWLFRRAYSQSKLSTSVPSATR